MTADYRQQPCHIVIIGASGDLSRKKLLPALFSLYCNDLLPEDFAIIGYARTEMSDEEFRRQAGEYLTCRYAPEGGECERQMDDFLGRCRYQPGQYDDPEDFKTLQLLRREISAEPANLVLYMAIPPKVFPIAARAIRDADMVCCDTCSHWSRVVLEKPFGHDSDSARELLADLREVFREEQTYRIDHYLGKEVIQNLMILRFANLIFEPVWNRHYIDEVRVDWGETGGAEGRGGYFDGYGIIRDVMQNHLLQIVALVGMEAPLARDADRIGDEKEKLLRAVRPLHAADVVVGQYTAANGHEGYLDHDDVPADSITPTYARATLYIDNARWHGVPFHLSAGKAIDRQMTAIRIRFKDVPYSIYSGIEGAGANELVIRVQPEEAIHMQITSKHPGMTFALSQRSLDLLYRSAFRNLIPEAYERLIYEVLRGDRSLFLRDDELAASWDIVTPALRELEAQRVQPRPYPYGSPGPEAAR